MKKIYFLLIATFLFNGLHAQNPNAFSVDNSFNPVDYPLNHYFVDSDVYKSTVLPDQSILVLTAKKIIKLRPDGLVDTSFNTGSGLASTSQYLYNFEVQPDGKILLIGFFSSFNGVTNNLNKALIRLNPDGSRDTSFIMNQLTLYNVEDAKMIAQPDGKIMLLSYLGGSSFMAKLNSNGSVDNSFVPLTGYEYTNLINLPDGKFLVSYVTGSQSKVMRLNANGTIDNTYTTTTYSIYSQEAIVNCIFLHDDKIYVGGIFASCNSFSRNGFVRLNLDGTVDTGYNSGNGFQADTYSTAQVYAIISQPDNKLLVSGSFIKYNYIPTANNIVRLNPDATLDATFNFIPERHTDNVQDGIRNISLFANDKIFISGVGYFDEKSPNIAILNLDGSRDNSFQHYCRGFDSTIIAALFEGNNSNIIAVGTFNIYNNEAKSGILKLNEDGTINNSFNFTSGSISPNANGAGFTGGGYDRTNGKLFLFGTAYNDLIKLNGDGSRDNSFSIQGEGFNGGLSIVHPLPTGDILVSGGFTSYNNSSASGLIRLNSAGYKVQNFGFNAKAIIELSDGSILVGGGGIRKYLIGMPFTLDNMFTLDSQITITEFKNMKVQNDGKILVYGRFVVNGVNKFIIRLNANGSYDSTFNAVLPESNPMSYADFSIVSLDVLPDQKIVLTYTYRDSFMQVRAFLIRLLNNGTYDSSIQRVDCGINSSTPSVKVLSSGKILLSGHNVIGYPGNENPQYRGLLRLTGEDYNFVNGGVKYDFDNNGCTSADIDYSFLKLDVNDGVTAKSFFTNQTGQYKTVVKEGNYTISPLPENPSYFTTSPLNVSLNFTSLTNVVNQDFCATANGNHSDVEIVILPITPARPGFNSEYYILYRNKGTNVESGTVSLVFNDNVMNFVSATPAASTQTMNAITWNFANLKPFESRIISFVTNLNSPMQTPALNSGDVLNYSTTITSATDETPEDNTFTFNQTVVNSFDPNDKTCLEGATIAPSEVGKYVHYMIRFENTGTFPAKNIVVKDIIDTNKFDITSLVPLKGSHNFYTRITDNNVEFIFENINLPFDNANNDGYVAFKIKTKPTLVVGNTFSNSASIYFDYNFPIVTNTATTTIQALSTQDFGFSSYFMLYPNPVNDVLNIETKQTIEVSSINIYNQLGQLVLVVPNAQNVSKVDVSNLASGNYFIKINSDKGTSNTKFVKK